MVSTHNYINTPNFSPQKLLFYYNVYYYLWKSKTQCLIYLNNYNGFWSSRSQYYYKKRFSSSSYFPMRYINKLCYSPLDIQIKKIYIGPYNWPSNPTLTVCFIVIGLSIDLKCVGAHWFWNYIPHLIYKEIDYSQSLVIKVKWNSIIKL